MKNCFSLFGSSVFKAAFLAALVVFSAGASADSYPSKPVRLIVGNPAGGLGDLMARNIGQALTSSMGQSFVVENRAGAAGVIATDAVAKSASDGYTLLVSPDSMIVVNQFVYQKLPYDPVKDIRSVALLGKAALVMVANPSLGVKTADQFFKMAKENPNAITYGSGGPGHPLHLAMELIASRVGFSVQHVPYRGSAPAVQGLLGGEVKVMIVGIAEVAQHIKAGKLIPLAVTGPNADALYPGLPLLKTYNSELDLSVWFGLFAPGSTKPEVITTLNTAVNKYLNTSDAKLKLADFGVIPTPVTTDELDTLIRNDRAKYGPLVKALGLRVE